MEWLRNPNRAFGYEAPIDLLARGEPQAVLDYIERLSLTADGETCQERHRRRDRVEHAEQEPEAEGRDEHDGRDAGARAPLDHEQRTEHGRTEQVAVAHRHRAERRVLKARQTRRRDCVVQRVRGVADVTRRDEQHVERDERDDSEAQRGRWRDRCEHRGEQAAGTGDRDRPTELAEHAVRLEQAQRDGNGGHAEHGSAPRGRRDG